jgi:hypothetical protein
MDGWLSEKFGFHVVVCFYCYVIVDGVGRSDETLDTHPVPCPIISELTSRLAVWNSCNSNEPFEILTGDRGWESE